MPLITRNLGSPVHIQALSDNQNHFKINVIDAGNGVPIEMQAKILNALLVVIKKAQ